VYARGRGVGILVKRESKQAEMQNGDIGIAMLKKQYV
jgi:hypothetical protein